jgi:uncharacterized membrane protein
MSVPDSPPDFAPAVFSAVLKPHRSLNLRGVRLVLVLVALASCVASVPFIVLGFWPVAGFYGLDVAILYFALRSSMAQARSYEEVCVTPLEILLRKAPFDGPVSEWRFNPAWTRLHREEHAEFGVQRLALVSRGQFVGLAAFLSPDEKASFGTALSAALAEARRGVTYNP